MNLAAFICPIICGILIHNIGWHPAFLMAGITTFLGTILFSITSSNRAKSTKLTSTNESTHSLNSKMVIGGILGILISAFFITHHYLSNFIFLFSAVLLLVYIIKKSFEFPSPTRKEIFSCLFLSAFAIIFFILGQQGITSLAVYTEYHVDRHLLNWEIPTTFFLALNPLFIIIFGPLLSILWNSLGKRNSNPSVIVKFAIGITLTSFGFLLLSFCINHLALSDGKIHWIWVVLSYFLQSLGEMLICPIGLSMMSQKPPKQMRGLMIGVWFFTIATGSKLAVFFFSMTASSFDLSYSYAKIYSLIAYTAIISVLFFMLMSIFIRRFYRTTQIIRIQ